MLNVVKIIIRIRSPKEPRGTTSQVVQLVENLPAKAGYAGDAGSIPVSGTSPEVVNGNPPQYSCLENAMDRGAWQAIVHGITKSQTQLSTNKDKEDQESKGTQSRQISIRAKAPRT